jgi:hypothetical protein
MPQETFLCKVRQLLMELLLRIVPVRDILSTTTRRKRSMVSSLIHQSMRFCEVSRLGEKPAGLSGPPYADTDESLFYIQLCGYVPTFNGSNLNASIDKIRSLHQKNAECEEGFLAHMGIFCSESRSDAFVKGLQSTILGDNLLISHLHLTSSPLSVLTSSAISALALSRPLPSLRLRSHVLCHLCACVLTSSAISALAFSRPLPSLRLRSQVLCHLCACVLKSSAISALPFSSPLHLCSSSTRARRPRFIRWTSRTTLCRPKTHGSLRASSTDCPVCSQ